MYNRPKVGLALGSGAARGFAHIGVIMELQDNYIPIDFVSGSSIGAAIGGLFCAEVPFQYTSRLLETIGIKYLLDFSISKKGFVLGNKIEEFLKLLIKVKTFEELKIPLSVVATDLRKGEGVIINSGDVVKAIRASIAIPGIFTPVNYNGRMLVDGGLVDRVPSHATRNMGADIVIGVDVGFMPGDDYRPQNILDIIIQTLGIMEVQILKQRIKGCDILIRPEVGHLSPYSFHNIEECIQGGLRAARESMDRIKKIIYNYSQSTKLECR